MSKPNLTIVGTPFSTFTRTTTLALLYKGLTWNLIPAAPHSKPAYEHHPFGYLPTLIIHEIDGKQVDIKLRESLAIVRYIDRIAPTPSLHLRPGDAILEEKMWEFVSLCGSFGYPKVEVGVIKIRVAAIDEGKLSEEEIREKVAEGVVHLRRWLEVIESLLAPGGYVFGETLTWADFFLYPLLADLEATHEGYLISDRLKGWVAKMKELKVVQDTIPGTLAVGGRPPADV